MNAPEQLRAILDDLSPKELGRLRNAAGSEDGTKWGLAAPTHNKLRDAGLVECVDTGRSSLRAVATRLGCDVVLLDDARKRGGS